MRLFLKFNFFVSSSNSSYGSQLIEVTGALLVVEFRVIAASVISLSSISKTLYPSFNYTTGTLIMAFSSVVFITSFAFPLSFLTIAFP